MHSLVLSFCLEDESTKVYFTSFDGRDDKWGAARPTWEESSCEEKLLGNRGLNHQLKVGSLVTRGCKFIILERKNAFLRGMGFSSLVLVVDIAGGRKKGDTSSRCWICLASRDPIRFRERCKIGPPKKYLNIRDVTWVERFLLAGWKAFAKSCQIFLHHGNFTWILGYDQFNGLDILSITTVIWRFFLKSSYSTLKFQLV